MREVGCASRGTRSGDLTIRAGARKQRRTHLILVAGLLLFHALCNWRYLGGDLYLQQKDVAAHLKVCTKYLLQSRDVLRGGAPPWERLAGLASLFHQRSLPVEHIWIWPRLAYLATAPAAALAGLTPRVIIFSNVIWLTVLLLSVYFIGERSMGPRAGLLSALVTSLFPGIYGLSRNYGLDFPLTAAVAASVYWLIRADGFSRRGPSLALGCAIGAGILVKMQILIFVFGPLLLAVGRAARRLFKREATARGVLLNAAIAAGAAMLLAAPFWWGNIGNIVTVFIRHAEANEGIDPHHVAIPLASARCLAYYAAAATVYLSPPFCILGALLLPAFLRSRFREKSIVLLWALAPYVLFTLVEAKYSVFYLPALPAVACVIGAGLASLGPGKVKYSLCAAAAGWGLVHFAQLSFGVGPAPYRGCRLYAGDALRDDGYPVWAHPAFPNNLERVARRFIGEIGRREAGNRYVRIGICEFDYSAKDYLFVDSLEYLMESVNPCVYVYRSHFAPESFLECMDSFGCLIVLEKGAKDAPDFHGLEEYFGRGRGAALAARFLKGHENLARLIEEYRGYELLDRALLSPEGVSAFLMRKPPFPVSDDAVIPATHVASTDVYIAYPWIGVDARLLRTPTIGDYDVLFPYDLDFPLVPPVRRSSSEPYYARYRLLFERGGAYGLCVTLMDAGASPPRAFLDGRPVGGGRPPVRGGGWERIGSFETRAGERELELRGDGGFPAVERLRLTREAGQATPPLREGGAVSVLPDR